MSRSKILLALLSSLVVGCTGSTGPAGPEGPTGEQGSAGPQGSGAPPGPTVAGAVYVSSNDSGHNEVWAFARNSDGSLSDPWAFSTGGAGTGAGLGDQGSVFADAAAKRVFVVNAGSNTVSMFAIEDDGSLTLLGTADSGGTKPISVTEHGGFVYVLDAGDATHAPNIAGFTASATGLTSNAVSLTLSTLVASSANAAQLSFTPDGKHLIATEKGTGMIDSYEVDATGIATGPHSQLAAGGATATPYGFGFSGNGTLLVTEAAGAVSAYTISASGALTATTTSLSTHQAAPCWMAAGDTWGWAINAGSDSVTGYNVAADGTLTLTKSSGVAASTANKPLDAALSSDGKFLYVLDSVDHAISTYEIAADGSLARRHDVIGLPATAVGLAAD